VSACSPTAVGSGYFVGAHPVRDALALVAFKGKSFRLPAAAESLSLCVATRTQERTRTAKLARRAEGMDARSQEKVTKEKGHPAFAPDGHPVHQVRVRATGFVDRASCPDAKLVRIHANHPAGFPTPARRCRGAPGRAAGHPGPHFSERPDQEQRCGEPGICSGSGSGFCFSALSPSAGHDGPLLSRGPCAAVSRGRQAAQRESTGMSTPFRQGRMPCRKARPRLTDLLGRMPNKRQAGWPSLLVTFLLATQEKSDSVAEGDRPLLLLIAPPPRAKTSRTRCAPTGAGDQPIFALAGTKSIAREHAPTGAKRVAPSANHAAGPRP